MKNIINKLILSICILFLASCSQSVMNSMSVMGPAVYVDDGNLESNITVGGRIEGEGSCTYIFGLFPLGDKYSVEGVWGGGMGSKLLSTLNPQDAKMEATYNALVNSGADMIVEPRYQVTTSGFFFFKTVTARVYGYKGTIDSFTQYKKHKPGSYLEEEHGYPPVDGGLKIEIDK